MTRNFVKQSHQEDEICARNAVFFEIDIMLHIF